MIGAKKIVTTTTTTTTTIRRPDGTEEVVRKQEVRTDHVPIVPGQAMVAEAEEEEEEKQEQQEATQQTTSAKVQTTNIIVGNVYIPPSINPAVSHPERADSFIKWEAPPAHYHTMYPDLVSSCTGAKRALLVGIVYKGTENHLEGCINDTMLMKKFLIQKYKYDPANIRMLNEDQTDPSLIPTRANILASMKWLVEGTQMGDSLVFQFSGHGGQTADLNGDESDGEDETIFPLDFKTAGMIIDDEMNEILVRGLPKGVRLTAVFDCCHSGSALDLPFTYLPDGRIKSHGTLHKIGKMASSTTTELLKGDVKGAIENIKEGMRQIAIRTMSQDEKVAAKGSLVADVILFSGCKDYQTSSDARVNGRPVGAMTYALTKAFKEKEEMTYGELFNRIRHILAEHFLQIPQISSARFMDVNQPFIM